MLDKCGREMYPQRKALFCFNGASFTRSPRGLLHTILAPSPHTSYCISTLFYFLYFLLVCLVIFLCFFAGLDPLSSTWPRFSPFGSVYACCRERLVVQLVSVWSQTVSPRCGTAGCATKTFLVTRRTRGTTRTRKSTGEILQHVLYLVHFTRFYMALRTQLICTRGRALRRRVQTSDRGSRTAVEKMGTLISWRPSSFSSRKSSRPTCLISASSSRSTHGMAAVFVSVTVGVRPPTSPNSIVHWGVDVGRQDAHQRHRHELAREGHGRAPAAGASAAAVVSAVSPCAPKWGCVSRPF